MNKIICTVIILVLVGCGPAISGVHTADSTAAESDGPHKTDLQRSKDKDYCHTICLTA